MDNNLQNVGNSTSKVKKILLSVKNLLKNGFFHILTGNFLNKAIGMISSIIIVRIIDKVTYADISYVDNIFSYISLASGLGMSSALLKFCSADQSKALDKAFVKFSVKIGGSFDLLMAIILCLGMTFISIPYPNARKFAWALVLYPAIDYLVVVGSVYMRTQLANKKYAYMGFAKSVFVCVFSIVLVLIIGPWGIVPARYLSVALVLFYAFIFYKKTTGKQPSAKLTKKQKKDFMRVGFSLGVASFFSGIMPINETFLVNNIIKDPIVTSNFRVAGLLPQLLFLVSGAVTVYYFPIIARMTDFKVIRKKVVQVAIVNSIVIIALVVFGMIFTPLIIRILYGEQYLDAVKISYLLWIMRATNCIVRMVPINMLPAIGKTKFNLYMSIISCVVQCGIDYLFINSMGINGVAIGATIVYALSGIAYWIYFIYCCRANEKCLSTESMRGKNE